MSTEAAQLAVRAQSYRDYPVELKAAVINAIEQNGGNVLATSKLFNLPPDTVRYWWANSDRFREIQVTSSSNLADKLENIAHDFTDSLSTHDLQFVTARDKAGVLSVVIDKMQLLRGLPTAITENVERHDVAIILQSALSEAIDVSPQDMVECRSNEATNTKEALEE